MKRLEGPLRNAGLLVLRVSAGAVLLGAHGWPKLSHFAERAKTFSDPLGVGSTASLSLVVFAEVVCALAVILGAATRLLAIPVVIFGFVAAFVQHADDPFSKQELPLLYLACFLTLALTGAGDWSVDGWWRRRK